LGQEVSIMSNGRIIKVGFEPGVEVNVEDSHASEWDHRWGPPTANGQPAVRVFKTMDVMELLEGQFTIEYLVNGVLVKNQPTIMAAPQKAMKTTTSLDLAISLAAGGIGGRFLGEFRVEQPVNVCVMTGESGMATVQETVRRICSAKGIDPKDIKDRLRVTDEVPFIKLLPDLNGVEKLLSDHGTEVLICDPVYQMIDGDGAGNLFTMGAQLKPLADICRGKNCTPILVHHTKRSSDSVKGFQPLTLEDISWSGFAEFARQWLLINRRERYEEGTGMHRIWLGYGGSAGHSGLWGVDIDEGTSDAQSGRRYDVTVHEAKEVRQTAQAERDAEKERQAAAKRAAALEGYVQRVKKVLKGNAGLTRNAIRDLAGIDMKSVSAAVERLIDLGEVVSETSRIQGQERAVFRAV
jgi:hypothetical protein